MDRHTDIVIVGASAANLSAAVALVETGQAVIVLDPDGASDAPGKEQARRHGVEILMARADRLDDRIVTLTGGHTIVAGYVIGGPTDANQRDWDNRYGGDQLWSGNPNGTLVNEVADLRPGRALDVGAGEGGDAVWLAERGWTVTASDISSNALDRVAVEARRRQIVVELLRVDANQRDAFPAQAFDLVSAQYASIPRRPDDRAVRNIMNAVAPGGTLLVVGHDLAPMRTPIDTAQHSRMFDPDAYVRPDDFAAAVAGQENWEIVKHAKVPRPPGSATAHHHVDDVVVRVRRRS